MRTAGDQLSLLSSDVAYVRRGGGDPEARHDQDWLRATRSPDYENQVGPEIRVADLFCGAGGLTLGALEAGREMRRRVIPVFAADLEASARTAYERNFFRAGFGAGQTFEDRPIELVLNGDLGTSPTESERALVEHLGHINLLMGGPPCQGHSNLNNHTRRDDPKNELYGRMARFAQLFEPDHIIVENVSGAVHDKGRIVQRTVARLSSDYDVSVAILHGERIGVPQTRHRVFVVASHKRLASSPNVALWEATNGVQEQRTFEWACADLPEQSPDPLHTPSAASPVTRHRIQWLHQLDPETGEPRFDLDDELRPPCHRDKPHRYQSVYGRINPAKPAPTITTGFTVMGQGRFVHPWFERTLTPREGARLQFFPDWFDFGDVASMTRKELVRLIGNAVPPKMSHVLVRELLRARG